MPACTPREQVEETDKIVPVFSPAIYFGTEFLQSLPTPEPIPAKTVLLTQGQQPSFRTPPPLRNRQTHLYQRRRRRVAPWASLGRLVGPAAPLALLGLPSLATVTTITPCSVSSISVDDFSQKLMSNQRVLRHFISSQCRELIVEQKHGIMQGRSAARTAELPAT